MPRIKPLNEYPISYFDAFQSVLNGEGEFTIECSSSSEARLIRAHLYTFRGVLRTSENEMAERCDGVTLHVDGKNLILDLKKAIGDELIKQELRK